MEISIIQAFSDILSNNTEKGEECLSSIRMNSGFIPILMKICLDDLSFEIKRSSARYLECYILDDFQVWPCDDINYLRANIISYLKFSIHEKIRNSFEAVAYHLILKYPPEEIFSQIDNALESEDYDLIFAGINMISQILAHWNISPERKESFVSFILRKLPALNEILNCMLCEGVTGIENFFPNSPLSPYSKDFCWKCILLMLSTYPQYLKLGLIYKVNMEIWWTKFKKILELSLGELENASANKFQYYDLSLFWQVKCTVAHILIKFFHYSYKKDFKIIILNFVSRWAAPFLETMLSSILDRSNRYLHDAVAIAYIDYIALSLKYSSVYEFFKLKLINSNQPAVITLLNTIILPLVYLKETDLKLWNDNPNQFEYDRNGPNGIIMIKNSASNLLINFIKNGDDAQVINYFAEEFLTADIIKKEALMTMLEMMIRKHVRSKYLDIIFSSVDKELNSHLKFSRFRVCRFYSELAFSKGIRQAQKIIILRKVYSLLQDRELVVKIEAATQIPSILTPNLVKEMAPNEINLLLNKYIGLIRENYTAYAVQPISKIIKLIPSIYIVPFVENLIEIFIDWSDIEDSEIEQNRTNLIWILVLTVYAFWRNFEYIAKISVSLMPVLDFCFANYSKSYQVALNLLKGLLDASPPESLNHLCKYAESVKNVVIYDRQIYAYVHELFLSFIKKYRESVPTKVYLDFANILVKNEGYERSGRHILMYLMENRKSLIDNFLLSIIQINYKFKSVDAEFICVALWNNPAVAMQALNEQNILASFIERIYEPNSSDIGCVYIKHIIAGICSLFLVIDEIPSNILPKFPLLFSKLIMEWNRMNEYFNEEFSSGDINYRNDEYLQTSNYNSCEVKAFEHQNYQYAKSPTFEKINIREFMRTSLADFNEKHPSIYRDIIGQLNEETILALDSL